MGVIVCDSASDLWKDQIQELNVKVINIPYSLDGEIQTKPLTNEEDHDLFYDKLKQGVVAKTQPIKKLVLEQFLDELLQKEKEVLFIHMSSALTTSYSTLQKLKDKLSVKYPDSRLYIVDSLQVSMGEGLIVYHASKLHKKGMSLKDVAEELESFKQHIACLVAVNDLSYLKRDAKLSQSVKFAGSLLGVKALLKCDKSGKLSKVAVAKGSKTILKKMVDYLTTYGESVADFPIVVMHSACEEQAKLLKQEVVKVVGEDSNVWIQPIGDTVGTHCGPNVIALIFRAKYR